MFALLAQARLAGGDTAMALVTTDVGRYVPDPKAALVRAKIAASQWKPRDERTEAGTVNLRLITAYRSVGPALKPDDTFEIEGVRTSDPMNRQLDLRNPWNALPLQANEELLLALHAGPSARVWIPLAMAPFRCTIPAMSSSSFFHNGVSTTPGQMALEVTPYGASTWAAVRVMLATPALDAE